MERRRRLRSSSRCSIRLMPGSSARSTTALRARSTGSKSAMEGLGFQLAFMGGGVIVRRCRDGVGGIRRRGCGNGETGGGREDAEVAGGRDGGRRGVRLWFGG